MQPVALLSNRKSKPPKTLVYSLWTMTNSDYIVYQLPKTYRELRTRLWEQGSLQKLIYGSQSDKIKGDKISD